MRRFSGRIEVDEVDRTLWSDKTDTPRYTTVHAECRDLLRGRAPHDGCGQLAELVYTTADTNHPLRDGLGEGDDARLGEGDGERLGEGDGARLGEGEGGSSFLGEEGGFLGDSAVPPV